MNSDLSREIYFELRRLARQQAIAFQAVLDQYACERLLYRLSKTEHASNFVLKGAMMLVVWTGNRLRATRDMDLRGLGAPTVEATTRVFVAAGQLDVSDGLSFDVEKIKAEPIKLAADYAGVNLLVPARLHTANLSTIVEVGFTDVITPAPQMITYPSWLSRLPAAEIRGYPIETTIAEKFSIMAQLGEINTRFKDYYDLWALSTFCKFNEQTLRNAMERTFAQRVLAIPTQASWIFSADAHTNARAERGWIAFQRNMGMAEAIAWSAVLSQISRFLLPICMAWSQSASESRKWGHVQGWTH